MALGKCAMQSATFSFICSEFLVEFKKWLCKHDFVKLELNVIHKAQEEINVVPEAALNMATKASKRALRKGFANFEAGKQHEVIKHYASFF